MSPRAGSYRPRPLITRPCMCGCGILITGRPTLKYLNTAHRMKAARDRARRAVEPNLRG